jgi:hypothetical protein
MLLLQKCSPQLEFQMFYDNALRWLETLSELRYVAEVTFSRNGDLTSTVEFRL